MNCYRMIVAILFFLLLLPSKSSVAQETLYAVFDYIHAKDPGAYLEIEKQWKKLHQHVVDEGSMVYWGLYQVAYPRGTAQAYNYVTVRLYRDFSSIEGDARSALGNEAQWMNLVAHTEDVRKIVKGEVYELVSTLGTDYPAMGKYVEMDYMDTPEGKEAVYIHAENTYWKPMQLQRVANGLMTGWDLWGLKYPSGTGGDYDYVTVNFFESYSQLAEPDYPPEVISGAHPDFGEGDFDRIVKETLETRSMVHMQLWIRLDQTSEAK